MEKCRVIGSQGGGRQRGVKVSLYVIDGLYALRSFHTDTAMEFHFYRIMVTDDQTGFLSEKIRIVHITPYRIVTNYYGTRRRLSFQCDI